MSAICFAAAFDHRQSTFYTTTDDGTGITGATVVTGN